MKKAIVGFLTGALIFGSIGVFAGNYVANTVDFKVMVNGKEFTSDPPPLEVEGRTYLPLRAIGDALGVPVEWNEELRQAEVGTFNSAKEIYEDDYIRASFIKVYKEDGVEGVFYLQLLIENKSSKNITVALSSASVNNISTVIGSGIPMKLAPNVSSKTPFIIMNKNLGIKETGEINNISFSFFLMDDSANKLEETKTINIEM